MRKNNIIVAAALTLTAVSLMFTGCGTTNKTPETTTQTETQEQTTSPTETTAQTTEPSAEVTVPENTTPLNPENEIDTTKMLSKFFEENPTDFPLVVNMLNLNDTSKDGKYIIKVYSGLDDIGEIEEISYAKSMVETTAFNATLVKVKNGADTKAIMNTMKDNIDPSELWITVEADDIEAVANENYIFLVMLDSNYAEDLTAIGLTTAFNEFMSKN